MTENEEFAQFAATLTAEVAPAPAPTPEAPVAETPAEKSADAPAIQDVETDTDVPKVEAKTEDKPEKVEEKKRDWAEAARKEKERRAARAQAKIEQSKREQELSEAKAKAAQLDEIMKLSKEKRLAALERLGMTIDDVNSEYVRDLEANPNKPAPEIAAAQKELAEIRAELKAFREEKERIANEQKKAQDEAQRNAVQAKYISKAAEVIKADPEAFETLGNHPQGSEVVFHFIAAHYAETATFDEAGNLIAPGEELDVREACRRVEELLLDEHKWVANVKKLRSPARAPDSQTLSGDMRQAEPRKEPTQDEDKEFLNTTLRLLKQPA